MVQYTILDSRYVGTGPAGVTLQEGFTGIVEKSHLQLGVVACFGQDVYRVGSDGKRSRQLGKPVNESKPHTAVCGKSAAIWFRLVPV